MSSDLSTVIMPLMRRVVPGMIAQEICSVQPMTGPGGSIFSIATEDPLVTRIRQLERMVCDTMTPFEEAWMDEFIEDDMIRKPMVWCLRELVPFTTKNEHGVYKKATHEEMDHIENEYWTMMAWIVQNHPVITFDLEMRGIKTKRGE